MFSTGRIIELSAKEIAELFGTKWSTPVYGPVTVYNPYVVNIPTTGCAGTAVGINTLGWKEIK